jgi:hypothetical protein
MDPIYDNLVGIDQTSHNSSVSMARSMRVVKQERSLAERDEKPRKQRKRALVAVSHFTPELEILQYLTQLPV